MILSESIAAPRALLDTYDAGDMFDHMAGAVFVDSRDVAHSVASCADLSKAIPAERREIPFPQLRNANAGVSWCRLCPKEQLWIQFDPLLPDVMAAVELLDVDITRGVGDGIDALFGLDSLANALLHAAHNLTATATANATLRSIAEDLGAECGARRKQALDLVRHDDAKQQALAAVRQWFGDDASLDDEPVLVALPAGEDALLDLLIAQFSLPGGPGGTPVLVVPRYVADHVAIHHVDVLATPAAALRGAEPDTAAAAVALWDPDGVGPLRHLRACLDVAGAANS